MNPAFQALGLSEALVRAVTELGYATPTPVQQQAIPVVLAGRDLLAGAQTGTGKTAGFVLPMLQRLAQSKPLQGNRRAVRALILAPTRELAAQVEQSVREYGKYKQSTVAAIYGGVSINPQISALKRGADIVVATPGRLLDHAGQRTIDLSHVEILVLDEADRMLDMGFLPDMKRVFALLPKKRQTLLFSATFPDEIRTLASTLLHDPATVQVAARNSTVDAVSQKAILVDRGRKSELLARLIHDQQWYQVLVFTRTKHGANRLADYLAKHDVTALAIHGNKSQNARTRALAEFKSGALQALVATDIAARGLDIEQLPHVVNFDLPHVPEDYVHRIGRTGRAGATGEAISLVCADDKALLADIEKLIRREVAREVIEGFAPNPNERAEPIQRGRGAARPAPRQRTHKDARPKDARSAKHSKPAQPQRASSQPSKPAQRPHAKPSPHAKPAAQPPSRARTVQSTDRRSDSDPSVRTNIPHLMQTTHRRGR